ncbi:acyl-CoA dehydrogenase family protein [Bosea sp. RCC_152_1]|uniref:acyl-CoA dehydrogenase family protein n=1 Tax=Bosea sp. RCC_152_1 TaxID=3239228 RepID=UPI003526938E
MTAAVTSSLDGIPSHFAVDLRDPYLAKVAELSSIFAVDAVSNDKAGGKPLPQLAALKRSGLLNLTIPAPHGGEGQNWSKALRIARELAKADGSVGHLYGYHFLSVHAAFLRGSPEQAADIYTRSAAGNWFWGNNGNSFSKTLFGRREGEYTIVDGFKPFTSGSHIADHLSISWEDELTRERVFAVIPAGREGLTVEDDWDGFGQRQTGSGRVTYRGVRVHESEVLNYAGHDGRPLRTLGPQLQQSVLLNVFVGSAQGALLAARQYTRETSRPWIHSGVESHVQDPWVQRVYGEQYARIRAATLLADEAAEALDAAWSRGFDLTEAERGEAAVSIAAANVFAGDVALEATSKIFEVMGARSATRALGLDRFWRNVRTHTLHNPAEYKLRNVGKAFLTGLYPEPAAFQ